VWVFFLNRLVFFDKPDTEILPFMLFLVVLSGKSWKNIEAEQIFYFSNEFIQKNQYFEPVHSTFKKLAMKTNLSTESPSDNPMDNLMKKLIDQISFFTHVEMESMEDRKLETLRVKMVYDMLKFALKYHSQDLSIPLTKETLYEIKLFEEAVGFLGSATHTLHTRTKEIFQYISNLDVKGRKYLPKTIAGNSWTWGVGMLKYLTDSNQNRKVSYIDHFLEKEEENFKLKISKTSPHEFDISMREIIIKYLSTGSEDLKNSTRKLMEQYRRYLKSLELYRLHTQHMSSSFKTDSCLDGGALKIIQSEIEKIEEPQRSTRNCFFFCFHFSNHPQ
jgi:hypothetical protein